MTKTFKRFLLIVIGLCLSVIIFEVVLLLLHYNNNLIYSIYKTNKDFFNFIYLDIHKPIFKIKNNIVYIQLNDFFYPFNRNTHYFIKQKQPNKLRIFIIGESTARCFDSKYLSKYLSKYTNNEIINIGISGYDSYRIEKISSELKNFQPDWVICCIGNNDGINSSFNMPKIDPIDINYLPYKNDIFLHFQTFILLSNFIYKEKKLTNNNVEYFFKKNIIKTVNNLKDCNIIFVDLPNNIQYTYSKTNKFNEHKEIVNILEKNNVFSWKNSTDYNALVSRINFIKQLPNKYTNVYITNLTQYLELLTDNNLGYNIFYDHCHWTKTTYDLLSQIITKIIIKKELNKTFKITIQKNKFNKDLISDHTFPETTVEFNNFGIKYNYNNIYKNTINKIKTKLTSLEITKISIFSYCLYINNKKEEAFKLINKLLLLYPNNYDVNLILAYIYYIEQNFELAKKFFNITKKLESNSKIDVEYLDYINNRDTYETKNSNY